MYFFKIHFHLSGVIFLLFFLCRYTRLGLYMRWWHVVSMSLQITMDEHVG